MEDITKDNIINDVIKRYPQTIAVFNDHRVDSCCGGGASIETTATRDGVDVSALLRDLNKTVGIS
jgi:regulator of cell morphogenesis and NO signaling